MFLEELKPIFNEFTQQPMPFVGGFIAGVLKLKLSEDPLKSWLEEQGVSLSSTINNQDNGDGPQSISIE